MSRVLRRLSWPLPWWSLVVPSLAVGAIVLADTWQMLGWQYQEWQRTSAEFHQQALWIAPLTAAVAAFFAGKLTPSTRIFALPTGRRVGWDVVRNHLAQLGIGLVGGYLLGLTPLMAKTILDAEYGGPYLLVMVSGILGITATMGIGYLLGTVFRTSLVAPLVFLLIFAVMAVGKRADTFSAVIPVLHVDPDLGQVENQPMVVFRTAFFFLVTVVSAQVSALLLANRAGPEKKRAAAAFGVTAVPVITAILGISTTPALFGLPSNPPRHCTEERGIEYCVHAGHHSQLSHLVEELDPVFAAYGEQDRVTHVHDRSLLFSTDRGSSHTHVAIIDPADTNSPHTDSPYEEERSHLAETLARPSCREVYPEIVKSGGGEHPTDMAEDLQQWVESEGEAIDSSNSFADFSQQEMQSWIAEHQEAIADCDIQKEDLPQ